MKQREWRFLDTDTAPLQNELWSTVQARAAAARKAFLGPASRREIRAHSAMFFEFKDSKIVSQRNYDCFEPW